MDFLEFLQKGNPVTPAIGTALDTYNREVAERLWMGLVYQAAKRNMFRPFGDVQTQADLIRAFESGGSPAAGAIYAKAEPVKSFLGSFAVDPLNLIPVAKLPRALGMGGKLAEGMYRGASAYDRAASAAVSLPLKPIKAALSPLGGGVTSAMGALKAREAARIGYLSDLVKAGIPASEAAPLLGWSEYASYLAGKGAFKPEAHAEQLSRLAGMYERLGQPLPDALRPYASVKAAPPPVGPPPPAGGGVPTQAEAAASLKGDIAANSALGLAPGLGIAASQESGEADPVRGALVGLGAGAGLLALARIPPAAYQRLGARARELTEALPKLGAFNPREMGEMTDIRAWITPEGEIRLANPTHEATARAALGTELPPEGSATPVLQGEGGIIRLQVRRGGSIGVDVAGPVTPAQMQTIRQLAARNRGGEFFFDLKDPTSGQAINGKSPAELESALLKGGLMPQRATLGVSVPPVYEMAPGAGEAELRRAVPGLFELIDAAGVQTGPVSVGRGFWSEGKALGSEGDLHMELTGGRDNINWLAAAIGKAGDQGAVYAFHEDPAGATPFVHFRFSGADMSPALSASLADAAGDIGWHSRYDEGGRLAGFYIANTTLPEREFMARMVRFADTLEAAGVKLEPVDGRRFGTTRVDFVEYRKDRGDYDKVLGPGTGEALPRLDESPDRSPLPGGAGPGGGADSGVQGPGAGGPVLGGGPGPLQGTGQAAREVGFATGPGSAARSGATWRTAIPRGTLDPAGAGAVLSQAAKALRMAPIKGVRPARVGDADAIMAEVPNASAQVTEEFVRRAAAEMGAGEAMIYRPHSSPANSILQITLSGRGPERDAAYRRIGQLLSGPEYAGLRVAGMREPNGSPVLHVFLGIDPATGRNLGLSDEARAANYRRAIEITRALRAENLPVDTRLIGGDLRVIKMGETDAAPRLQPAAVDTAGPLGPVPPGAGDAAGATRAPAPGGGNPPGAELDTGFLSPANWPIPTGSEAGLGELRSALGRVYAALVKDRARATRIAEAAAQKVGRDPSSLSLDEVRELASPADAAWLGKQSAFWHGDFLAEDMGKTMLDRLTREDSRALGVKEPGLWGKLIGLWREQALLAPAYHVLNATDAAIKNAMHGVRPFTTGSRVQRMQAAWGELDDSGRALVPQRIAQNWAIYGADPGAPGSRWANIPTPARVAGGAAIGAMGGPLGAAAGAGAGALMPKLASLNRQLAGSIELAARSSAWLGEKSRYVKAALPSFLDRLDPALAGRLAGSNGMFSPQALAELGAPAEAVREWQGVLSRADRAGVDLANHIHFDYQSATRLDDAMRNVFAFHFWATRNLPFYLEHLLQMPSIATALWRYNQLSESEIERRNLTGRFRGLVGMGGLGDAIAEQLFGLPGGETFGNPLSYLSILQQIPKVSYAEGPQALLDTVSAVGLAPNPVIQMGLRAAGVGKGEPMGNIFRLSGPISGALGALEGRPVSLERPISDALGGFNSDEYYTRNRLAEASVRERGMPNAPEYVDAMGGEPNDQLRQAEAQVAREKLASSYISFLLGTPMKVLPREEAMARAARSGLPERGDTGSPFATFVYSQAMRAAEAANPLATTYSVAHAASSDEAKAQAEDRAAKEQMIIEAWRKATPSQRQAMLRDPDVAFVVMRQATRASAGYRQNGR